MSSSKNDKLLIETAAAVRYMNERLFGDGSEGSGSLARLYTLVEKHNDAAVNALKEHAAQDKVDFKSVNDAVTKVDKKVVWYSGGIAVLGTIGTVLLGALVAHFASVVSQAAQSAH